MSTMREMDKVLGDRWIWNGYKNQAKLPCKVVLEQKWEGMAVTKERRVVQLKKTVYAKAL